MTENEILVKMGDYAIAYEGTTLTTLGLGSCVGVVIYDRLSNVYGMAHVMLPDSKESQIKDLDRKALFSAGPTLPKDDVKGVLTKHEFSIVAEADQKDSLISSYKTVKPSLTYIDTQLPPTSGEEAMVEIKNMNPSSNIIMMVSHLDKPLINSLLIKGADDVMMGPFTEKNILDPSDHVIKKNFMRFADIAIPKMIESMKDKGAKKENMKAKVVGGACMFAELKLNADIGKRNYEAVKKILVEYGIPIEFEEVGGATGRTIRFDTSEAKLRIHTKDGEKVVG